MKTGSATLPLHGGKVPRWLFTKMKELSRALIEVMLIDYPSEKILEHFSDPFWFQSLGCVLGFDWHSSGVTTTTMGALKEAFKDLDAGIYVCGGKGKTSLKTPEEIKGIGDKTGIKTKELIYASRMTAKVDNSAIQDGYSIYHHTIIFTNSGYWCVVQQGLNDENGMARRYHWFSGEVMDFVNEPHKGIISEGFTKPLNMIAKESCDSREVSSEIARDYPERTIKELERIRELTLPKRHLILFSDININRLLKPLKLAFDRQPENFETLLGISGVGPATIRALALIGELLYGKPPSFDDPARYSFAHGGKDGIPYPVDRKNYQCSIDFLKVAVSKAKIGDYDKLRAIRRLVSLI